MELCSIASGSSGNCICVGSDDCHVLIDAGISGKRIENGLNSIDLKTADMQGILITHEHIDHIAGLGVIARRYGIPMYATGETVDAILHTKTVGKIDEALFQVIESEREFTIGDLTIEPVSISHDAADQMCIRDRLGLLHMIEQKENGCLNQKNIFDNVIACLLYTSVAAELEEGKGTVGTLMNVSHISATPLGMEVTAKSELVEIDRKRLVFKVEAFDERGRIGEGTQDVYKRQQ